MRTECKVRPVYSPTEDVTCGYIVPNCQLLARIAPPVPGDAMRRLFWPRTFTKLRGMKEGALTHVPGEEAPNAFEFDEECDGDPYEHLSPPDDPWPMAIQPTHTHCDTMKSQITESLLHGERVALSPSIEALASRKGKKSKVQTPDDVPQTRPDGALVVPAAGRPSLSKSPQPEFYDPRELLCIFCTTTVQSLLLTCYLPESIVVIRANIDGDKTKNPYSKRSPWKVWDGLKRFGDM